MLAVVLGAPLGAALGTVIVVVVAAVVAVEFGVAVATVHLAMTGLPRLGDIIQAADVAQQY